MQLSAFKKKKTGATASVTFKHSPHFQHPFTCKSLGPNYLQIICHFTILHKITGHMMKHHGGGGSEVSDPNIQKMWNRSVSLITLTDLEMEPLNKISVFYYCPLNRLQRAGIYFPPTGCSLSLFLFLPFFLFSVFYASHFFYHFPYFHYTPSHFLLDFSLALSLSLCLLFCP